MISEMSAWRPTWHLHTMSASIAKRSTTFPFPSSPHWAPNTTVTLLWGSRGIRSESTLSLERLSEGSPFREVVSWPLDIVLSAAMPQVWRTAWTRKHCSNMVARENGHQNKSPVAKKKQKRWWSLQTHGCQNCTRNIYACKILNWREWDLLLKCNSIKFIFHRLVILTVLDAYHISLHRHILDLYFGGTMVQEYKSHFAFITNYFFLLLLVNIVCMHIIIVNIEIPFCWDFFGQP